MEIKCQLRNNMSLPCSVSEAIPTAEIPDTIPVASSTDWQAAFGFTSSSSTIPPVVPSVDSTHIDDDLGIVYTRHFLFHKTIGKIDQIEITVLK